MTNIVTIETDIDLSVPFVVVTLDEWNALNEKLTAEYNRAKAAEATATLLRAGLTEALYEMGDNARDYFTSQFLEATP